MFDNIVNTNKKKNNYYNNFIEDSDILFKIEQIPEGLNIIDYLRFKSTMRSTIIGTSIAVFKILNHLVFIYTHIKDANRRNVLFINKINFLKQMIKEDITSEIWVVNDRRFLCIGIVDGVPLFIRYFDSFYEVNENMCTMIKSLDQFKVVESVRLFNANKNDIEVNNVNIFEYSERLLIEKMNGQTSIEQYIKVHYCNKKKFYSENLLYYFIFFGNSIIFLLLVNCKNTLYRSIHEKQLELSNIEYKNIPSINHYLAIKKTYSF